MRRTTNKGTSITKSAPAGTPVDLNPQKAPGCPKRKPVSAALITSVAFMRGSDYAFHVSSNRDRSLWILWVRTDKGPTQAFASIPGAGHDRRSAAWILLRAWWAQASDDRFHVCADGLLDRDEIDKVATEGWGHAPSKVETFDSPIVPRDVLSLYWASILGGD